MDDLKDLRESLTSSLATEMKEVRELREMMTRFMAAQKVDPPAAEESDEGSAAAKAKANSSTEAEAHGQQKLSRIKGMVNNIAPLTQKESLTTKRNPMCIPQTHLSLTLM